jgi:hypothetical protein
LVYCTKNSLATLQDTTGRKKWLSKQKSRSQFFAQVEPRFEGCGQTFFFLLLLSKPIWIKKKLRVPNFRQLGLKDA